jgi:hypothetical protein
LFSVGFIADGVKSYRRVVGDIFQGVFLHVETRIRKEFMIEYCAFLICVPHDHYSLEHGGRFPVGSQATWYRADTPDCLEQSMTRVQAAVPALLEWFHASETLEGFLTTFSAHCATQPPRLVRNGHTSLTLACGAAALGDLGPARQHAERALSEYEGILASFREQYPKADHWAPEYIERTRSLIAAINGAATDALLAEWRALTVDALKIPV